MNLDVGALQAIFEMLQQHFPERLGQGVWFVNAPRIFWSAWRCVCPFISTSTRNRIHFCTTNPDDAQLSTLLGVENLPTALGGLARDTPIEEAAAVIDSWVAVEDDVDSIPPLSELLQ